MLMRSSWIYQCWGMMGKAQDKGKRWERRVCTDLGGSRTGPMGYGLPDCKGLRLAVECKSDTNAILLTSHIEQAETNGDNVELPWVLVYRDLRNRKLVVMEYDTFVNLYKRSGEVEC